MLCLSFGFPFLALKEVKSLVSICPGWQHLFCCCQSSRSIAVHGRNSWPTTYSCKRFSELHGKCSGVLNKAVNDFWNPPLEWNLAWHTRSDTTPNFYIFTFLLRTRPGSGFDCCKSCSFTVAPPPAANLAMTM